MAHRYATVHKVNPRASRIIPNCSTVLYGAMKFFPDEPQGEFFRRCRKEGCFNEEGAGPRLNSLRRGHVPTCSEPPAAALRVWPTGRDCAQVWPWEEDLLRA